MIGIDDDKRLYVWGLRPLKTIENEQHLANSTLPLLWSMQLDLSQLSDMRINGAAADEYQIYIFAHVSVNAICMDLIFYVVFSNIFFSFFIIALGYW